MAIMRIQKLDGSTASRKRRKSRKPAPPSIEVTHDRVTRPGNSGSTLGSPPPRDDGSPEEQANKSLALSVARLGFPERAPDRQPYMFVNPNVMCYRNSALAMLLNIEPFVGWLRLYHKVSLAGTGEHPESIMSYLHRMAQMCWLSPDTSEWLLEIAIDEEIIPRFWTDVNNRWQWGRPNTQEDVSEFLDHFWGEARGEMVHGRARDVLDAMFSTVKIPRVVAGPNCAHTRVRETDRAHEHNQLGLFFNVVVNSQSARTLMGVIQTALHARAAEKELCLLCNDEPMPGHRFYKFRTLPEVLVMSISRFDVQSGRVNISGAQCELPDVLDLSEFRENEDKSRDQSAVYRYAAAIFHWGTSMKSGHYVTHVRNKDGTDYLLDDMANPRVRKLSLKTMNDNNGGFDVVVVAYVKVHEKTAGEELDPDAEERVLAWWQETGQQQQQDHPDQNPPAQTSPNQETPKSGPSILPKTGLKLRLRPPKGDPAQQTTKFQEPTDPAPTLEQPPEVKSAPSFGPLPPLSPRLAAAESELAAALGQSSIRGYDVPPHAFSHQPANTCYRNSAMTLLMHVDPFVNWLHVNFRRAVTAEGIDETTMGHLGHIAEDYWDIDKHTRRGGGKQSLWVFWQYFTTPQTNPGIPFQPGGAQAGTRGSTRQNDPSDFIVHVFENAQTHLEPNQLEVLRRMFGSTKLVETYCEIEKLNIRRASYEDWTVDFPIHRIGFRSDEATNLEDCFKANLFSYTPFLECSQCESINFQAQETTKFRELPEILLVQLQRAQDVEKGVNRTKCTIPENLDLTDCLLEEDRQRGQHGSYELIGVIAHAGTGTSGHEITYVRDAANRWHVVDDMGRGDGRRSASVDEINNNRQFTPVLMAYRKRQNAATTDGVSTGIPLTTSNGQTPGSVLPEHSPPNDPSESSTSSRPVSPKPVIPASDEPVVPEPEEPVAPESVEPIIPESVKLITPKPVKSVSPKQDLPQRDPLQRESPDRAYRKMGVQGLKLEMKRLGIALDSKKHPADFHVGKIDRHYANGTAYDEYTVVMLKEEIARRGLDPKGINSKATAMKALSDDDKKKGYKGPSIGVVSQTRKAGATPEKHAEEPGKKATNQVQKPVKKSEKSAIEPGKEATSQVQKSGVAPEKPAVEPVKKPARKSRRSPKGGKKPEKSEDKVHDKPDVTKDDTPVKAADEAPSSSDGNKDITQAGDGPTPEDHSAHPPTPPGMDPDRYTISASLQVMGKPGDARADPLTCTWSLPAGFRPELDTNIIGTLTITAPDGQKARYSLPALNRQIFHIPSLAMANKKRKTPDGGNDDDDDDNDDDDDSRPHKRHKGDSLPPSDPNDGSPKPLKKPPKPKQEPPKGGGGGGGSGGKKDTASSKDVAVEKTPDEAPSLRHERPDKAPSTFHETLNNVPTPPPDTPTAPTSPCPRPRPRGTKPTQLRQPSAVESDVSSIVNLDLYPTPSELNNVAGYYPVGKIPNASVPEISSTVASEFYPTAFELKNVPGYPPVGKTPNVSVSDLSSTVPSEFYPTASELENVPGSTPGRNLWGSKSPPSRSGSGSGSGSMGTPPLSKPPPPPSTQKISARIPQSKNEDTARVRKPGSGPALASVSVSGPPSRKGDQKRVRSL